MKHFTSLWKVVFTCLSLFFNTSAAQAMPIAIDVTLDKNEAQEMIADVSDNQHILLPRNKLLTEVSWIVTPDFLRQLQLSSKNLTWLDETWLQRHGFIATMNWDLFEYHLESPIKHRKHTAITLGATSNPLSINDSFYVNFNASAWQDNTWSFGSELSYTQANSRFLFRPFVKNNVFSEFPFIQYKQTLDDNTMITLGTLRSSWIPEINMPQMYGAYYARGFHPNIRRSQIFHKSLFLRDSATVRVYYNDRLITLRRLTPGAYDFTELSIHDQLYQVKIEIQYDDGSLEVSNDSGFLHQEWMQDKAWGWASMVGQDAITQETNALADIRYGINEQLTLGMWAAQSTQVLSISSLARFQYQQWLISTDLGISNSDVIGKIDISLSTVSGSFNAYYLKKNTLEYAQGFNASAYGCTLGMTRSNATQNNFIRYNTSLNKQWFLSTELRQTMVSSQVSDTAISLQLEYAFDSNKHASFYISQTDVNVQGVWKEEQGHSEYLTSMSYNYNYNPMPNQVIQQSAIAQIQYNHLDWGNSTLDWSQGQGVGVHLSGAVAHVEDSWAWGQPITSAFVINRVVGNTKENGITRWVNGQKQVLQQETTLASVAKESNINIQYDVSNLPMGWSITPEFSNFKLHEGGGILLTNKVNHQITMMAKLYFPWGDSVKQLPLSIDNGEQVFESISGATGRVFLPRLTTGHYTLSTVYKGEQFYVNLTIPKGASALWNAGKLTLKNH